jgi:putative flavoprotein involved in K+ transport
VADYLERYAAALPVAIHTNTRVLTVREDDDGFVIVTADGRELEASGIITASGSFSNPHRLVFPGQAASRAGCCMSRSTAIRRRMRTCGWSW